MSNLNNHLEEIDQVVKILKQSNHLLFITGAGMSADSGLPTYRGIGGLYNHDTTNLGIPIEYALSGQMLHHQPEITWKYLDQIESACRGAEYNRGHQVIAEMEQTFQRVWTLTQNVDGFHKKAGSKKIIDVHGDFQRLYCFSCHYEERVEDYSHLTIPPACPQCQSVLRPDVVLFGEMLPLLKVEKLYRELERGFDVVFSIGTTSSFSYIVEPVILAKRQGWTTIEINPDQTILSDEVDIYLPTRAAETLDKIWSEYRKNS